MSNRIHELALRTFGQLPPSGKRFLVRRVAPSFTVGVMCFVRRDGGDVLLVRHSYRDAWGLPGGLLARGETWEDAVHREVREETGLEITVLEPPTVVVDPEPRRVDIVLHCRLTDADDAGERIVRSAEVHDARWFSLDDLPELQEHVAAGLDALIEASPEVAAAVRGSRVRRADPSD